MDNEVSEELQNLIKELSRQEAHSEELEGELKLLRKEFEEYRREKQEEESRRLRTALIAAGGIILSLAGFVWYDLIWPVLKAARP